MPKWLKVLYKKTFEKQADEFFAFLELIQNLRKNVIKRMLKWHEFNKKKLTIDSALEFVTRC